jgi:hypothetical protein
MGRRESRVQQRFLIGNSDLAQLKIAAMDIYVNNPSYRYPAGVIKN